MRLDKIIGYECKLCGASGHFDEFPKHVYHTEFGKECDTFCKNENCDGQDEDIWEIIEKGEEIRINDLLR